MSDNLKNNYIKNLKQLQNSRIGIVYTYRDEQAKGFGHYDIWEISIVSDWAIAVEEIGCIPYIIDVKTFGEKALNDTLPPLDYVINLNAGNSSLSTLALIPSLCGFLDIPCIPANTEQIITGEHKHYSNLIAQALGLNVPKYIDENNLNIDYISKPIGLGSSFGIEKNKQLVNNDRRITQEFIPGMDITTPFIYNPIINKLEVIPSILYIPEPLDENWFYSNKLKFSRENFKVKNISLNNEIEKVMLDFVSSFGIYTYCRIDSRIYCSSKNEMKNVIQGNININKINFLEINPMPTIFNDSVVFKGIQQSTLKNAFEIYNSLVKKASYVGFLLSSSIISIRKKVKAKNKKLQGYIL